MMAQSGVASLQQINLYNSTLMPTREIFSARLIVAWVVIAGLAMAAVAWWSVIETKKVGAEIANQASRLAAERARVAPAMVAGEEVLTPQQLNAREQALRSQQAVLETRRAARDVLKRGIANDKDGPSALMRLIASSVPPQVWLTEVRVLGGQVDVSGKTLDPQSVNVWLERMRASAYLADKPTPVVRIERADTAAPVPARVLPVYTFGISAILTSPFAEEGARP